MPSATDDPKVVAEDPSSWGAVILSPDDDGPEAWGAVDVTAPAKPISPGGEPSDGSLKPELPTVESVFGAPPGESSPRRTRLTPERMAEIAREPATARVPVDATGVIEEPGGVTHLGELADLPAQGGAPGAIEGAGLAGLRTYQGLARLTGASEEARKTGEAISGYEEQFPAATTGNRIGRGVGGAAALLAAPGGIWGMLGTVGAQSVGAGYEQGFAEAKAAGKDDAQAAEDGRMKAFTTTIKSVPELAAYWLIGLGAAKAVAPLVKQAGPLATTLATGAAATAANVATSSGMRAIHGEPAFTAEGLATDATFGFLAHGIKEGATRATTIEGIRDGLRTAPESALRMAATDPEFRKTAPYDPKLIDEELARRGVPTLPPEIVESTNVLRASADAAEAAGATATAKAARANADAIETAALQSARRVIPEPKEDLATSVEPSAEDVFKGVAKKPAERTPEQISEMEKRIADLESQLAEEPAEVVSPPDVETPPAATTTPKVEAAPAREPASDAAPKIESLPLAADRVAPQPELQRALAGYFTGRAIDVSEGTMGRPLSNYLPPGSMLGRGMTIGDAVKAGVLELHDGRISVPRESAAGQSNLTAAIEKNISDARLMSPDDPAGFLRKMADSARSKGNEAAATNFEAAIAALEPSSKPAITPVEGAPVVEQAPERSAAPEPPVRERPPTGEPVVAEAPSSTKSAGTGSAPTSGSIPAGLPKLGAEGAPKRTFKRKVPEAPGGSDAIERLLGEVGKITHPETARHAALHREGKGAGSVTTGRAGEYDPFADLPAGLRSLIFDRVRRAKGETDTGIGPAKAAQGAQDAGIIKGDSPDELAQALRDAWTTRLSHEKASKSAASEQKAVEAKAEAQTTAFETESKVPQPGAEKLPASALNVGDVVEVNGETMKVIDFDMDTGNVTLEDGSRYGVQEVKDGSFVYGEVVEKAKSEDPDWLTMDESVDTPAKAAEVGAREQLVTHEVTSPDLSATDEPARQADTEGQAGASGVAAKGEVAPVAPEWLDADRKIAWRSILEKQGAEKAAEYAENMKRVGEWRPSSNVQLAPPVTKPLPQLREGKSSDDLLQGDNDVFNLVSETAADKVARLKREQADELAKKAKDAAEAKALQDRQQLDIFAEKPSDTAKLKSPPKGFEKYSSSPTKEGIETSIAKFYGGEKKSLVPNTDKPNHFAVVSESGKVLNTVVIETERGFYFGKEEAPTPSKEAATPIQEPSTPSKPTLTKAQTEKLHTDAYSIADTIANSVAKGNADSVQEAAFDAAYRNAAASIDSSGQFNTDFMRKSAMTAAGKEAAKLGTTLNEPIGEGETTGQDMLASPDAGPVENAQVSVMRELADKEIAKLPRSQRLIMEGELAGKSDPEIAKSLGLTEGSVRTLKSKARKTLADKLSGLLGKAIDATKSDPTKFHVDPFLIQSVGKPALRAALKVIKAALDAGKPFLDALEEGILSLKASMGAKWNRDIEAKAREFYSHLDVEKATTPKPPAPEAATEPTLPKPPIELPTIPSEAVPPSAIGGYNADVEARQVARGQTPTMSEARKEDPVTWQNAMDEIERNPVAPEALVERIHRDPKKPITDEEQQMLTWQRATMEDRMAQEAERAVDPTLSPQEQAVHQTTAELYEAQLLRAEEANRMAGTAAGRTLRSRQMEMNEDYTFAGLMMRRRKLTGEVVPKDVAAKIKAQADEIAASNVKIAETEAALDAANLQAAKVSVLEATIADLQSAEGSRPKFGKEVFAVAQRVVNRWKAEAAQARIEMRKEMGYTSAIPIPTKTVMFLAKMIRAKIGEFGLSKAESGAELLSEFGPEIAPFLNRAWNKAQSLIGREKIGPKAKATVSSGVRKKGEKTPQDAAARAKAESAAGMELSNRTAYEAVRAVINSGVTGELEIMQAAHDLLAPAYPDLTLNELDVKFTDYGNAKYPSTEANKVALAKQRRLRQMQAAIDDVKRRGETAKSGVQRAKADEDVRKRQAELKAAIEEYGKEVPTSPEQLANRERARLTAAKNAIEDLDRELRTGEEKIRAQPKMPSAELEQLQSELAAMRDLKKEIQDAQKPEKSPEEVAQEEAQKGVDRAAAALDRQQRINSGEITPERGEKRQPLSPLEKELRDQTEELRKARRAAESKSEAQKALDSALVARERAAQTLDDISTGTIKPAAIAKEALTQLEEDIRLETDAMKQLAAEMRRAAKPPKDPNFAKEQAQIRALEKAIERYQQKTAANDFTTKGKTQGPDSRRVTALREVLDSRRSMYETARKAGQPVLSPEQRYNATQAKNIARQLAAIEARIAARDFAPRPKKVPPVLTKANLDAKAEFQAKKNEVKQGEEEYRLAHRTQVEKAKERAALLLQSVRGIVLGSDIGVLTRQGLFSWSRPVTAIKATGTAFKAALSPASMARWEIEVRDRQINGEAAAPKRKEAGLSLTDTVAHPEELVITRLLSRIPDFKVGGRTVRLAKVGQTLERFQTTFINAVRADLFDSAIRQGMSPAELKLRANFINSATGRSNIKHVPKAMSIIMTSPRYETSRWEMLAQPVRNLGALARSGVKGELDRAALANLKDMTVTMAGIYALFKLAEIAGYSVEWDPESSDFLKMRKGDETWDVSAGLAPRIRDVLRLYVALTHPSYSENIGKVMLGSGLRTINPALKTPVEQISVAAQRAGGDDDPKLPFSGFRSDEEREGWIALAPLIVQGVNQSLEDGPGQATFTAAREFVGSSVNRYPEPSGNSASSSDRNFRPRESREYRPRESAQR